MKNRKNIQPESGRKTKAAEVKKLIKRNKTKALSVAVAITVGTALSGCSSGHDDSYYLPGTYQDTTSSASSQSNGTAHYSGGGGHYYGSYYYGRGSTYRSGSWGDGNVTIGRGTGGGGGTNGIGG